MQCFVRIRSCTTSIIFCSKVMFGKNPSLSKTKSVKIGLRCVCQTHIEAKKKPLEKTLSAKIILNL